jgi:hypothetical protein
LGLRGHFGIQELQEFRSWELGEDFPREMLVLDFGIWTLLAYSATPELLTPEFRFL